MDKSEYVYDNKFVCVMCSGKNQITIVDSINELVTECKTKCYVCGHKNYWAFGFYQLQTPQNK